MIGNNRIVFIRESMRSLCIPEPDRGGNFSQQKLFHFFDCPVMEETNDASEAFFVPCWRVINITSRFNCSKTKRERTGVVRRMGRPEVCKQAPKTVLKIGSVSKNLRRQCSHQLLFGNEEYRARTGDSPPLHRVRVEPLCFEVQNRS